MITAEIARVVTRYPAQVMNNTPVHTAEPKSSSALHVHQHLISHVTHERREMFRMPSRRREIVRSSIESS